MAAMSPAQVMQLIYILYGIIAALVIILVFVFWKTPALTFLWASMFKRPLIYVIGKDHIGHFRTFKPSGGSANVKKLGMFSLTENSHTLESGSKIPIYFAFRDLAATLLPEYPAIIQEIREQGFLVNNLEDISAYILKIKTGMIQNYPIHVRPFKTYKFHDLANMFPNNLDPTFIDSTVQCEVAKFTKLMKIGPMALTTIVVVMIVGAVAVFIINMAFKGKINASDCKAMIEAAKGAGVVAAAVVKTNLSALA